MKNTKIFKVILLLSVMIFWCSTAWASVSLSAFPDPVLRAHLIRYDRYGGFYADSPGWEPYHHWGSYLGDGTWEYANGILEDEEIENIVRLSIGFDENPPKTLKGIKYLTALIQLYCSSDELTELDVSGLKALTHLYCGGDQLTSLNVSGCTALQELHCSAYQLTELNVSGCTALEQLDCQQNQLRELDASGCTALEYLWCHYDQLTELDVSGCTALKYLDCEGNQLTKLNVSGCTALQVLVCPYNQFTSLNVSGCTALQELDCRQNQLTSLDVSRCTALERLKCAYNQLTELDLSKNQAFGYDNNIHCYFQVRKNLKVKKTEEGYEVNLSDYVSNLENIDAESIRTERYFYERPIRYDKSSGIAVFSEYPMSIYYEYQTHSPYNTLMDVTIKHGLGIAVLERKDETDSIIRDMNNNSYINEYNNAITEGFVSTFPANTYEKEGFTADGNSRLILRVQTENPGTVTFSFKDNIGATLENLTNRKSNSTSSLQIKTSDVGAWGHQASAVLIAPETFPIKNKKFPSDKFKVHVKFEPDDSNEDIEEDDIELKIEAAPVVLIHGLFGSPKTFGFGKNLFDSGFGLGSEGNEGIYHSLKNNGFEVSFANYENHLGPSQVISGTYNRIFNHLATVFGEYAKKNIVCTKADIVGFGSGGLIARKFLTEEGKNEKDGNNWTTRSYKQGMVRRVITVATPHRGTPWADLLLVPEALDNFFSNLTSNQQLNNVINLIIKTKFPALFLSNVTKSTGLNELATFAKRDYGFPSDVPMYAIYGNAEVELDLIWKAIDFAIQRRSKGEKSFNYRELKDTAIFYGMKYAKEFLKDVLVKGGGAVKVVGATVGLGLLELYGAISLGAEVAVLARNLTTEFLFKGEPNDIYISASSSAGDFGDSRRVYIGKDYEHRHLGQQSDVGTGVVTLLKESVTMFKTFGKNAKSTSQVMKSSSAPTRAKITLNSTNTSEEFKFIELLKLNVEPSIFKISDNNSQTVKFRVTAEKAISEDIFCAIEDEENDNGVLFIILPSDNTGRNFYAEVTFGSKDIGIKNITCFAHNPETVGTGIYSSNAGRISVLNDMSNVNVVSLDFLGNETIYTNVNSENPIELYATDENENIYDVSSPLNGTKWTVKNPEIAKVNDSGYVQGLKEGATTLTANYKNLTASISVDVGAAYAEPEPIGEKPTITTTELNFGIMKTPYEFQLEATGTSPINWTAKGLPKGLNINGSGLISGTPTKSGTIKFTVTAKNDYGTVSEQRSIIIYEAPTISTKTIKTANSDKNFSFTLQSKGTKPFTWNVSGLPEGLEFNSDKGTISGKTKKSGVFPVEVSVSNIASSDTKIFNLTVKGVAPVIKGSLPSKKKINDNYEATFTATGTEPITWLLEGNLPEGLTFYPNTATLSGIPTETCKNVALKLIASNDVKKVSKNFKLTITGEAPKILTTSLTEAVVGENYNCSISVTGDAKMKIKVSGLPDNLIFNEDELTITGIPSKEGKFNVTFTAENGVKKVSKKLKLLTGFAPEILTTELPSGQLKKNYNYTLNANGSKNITWSLSQSSKLPKGVKFSKGKFSGSPQEEGTFEISVIAKNSFGEVNRDFNLVIDEILTDKNQSLHSEIPAEFPQNENVTDDFNNDLIFDDENITLKSKSSEIIISEKSRTIKDLTSQELNLLENYTIAAVLPEIKVKNDNQYDFEIKLDDKIQTGAKLFWFAFSDNHSEDDEIADFYNSSGEDINCVPDDKIITVSAWLNSGVIYRPVIAIQK